MNWIKNYHIWLLTISIPLLGYGLTYVFEWGYFNYFHIPLELIKIEFNTVVFAIIRVIFILGLISLIYYFVIMPLYKTPFWNIFASILYYCLIISLPFFIMYRSTVFNWLLFFGVNVGASLIIFLIYFIPMIHIKKKNKISLKKQMQNIKETEPANTILNLPFVFYLAKPIKKRFLVAEILIALIWLFSISYNYGNGEATSKETFLITSQPEEAVVLRTYDSGMLCAPLDRNTNTIKPDIFIIQKESAIVLKQEHTGRLKVTPNK